MAEQLSLFTQLARLKYSSSNTPQPVEGSTTLYSEQPAGKS